MALNENLLQEFIWFVKHVWMMYSLLYQKHEKAWQSVKTPYGAVFFASLILWQILHLRIILLLFCFVLHTCGGWIFSRLGSGSPCSCISGYGIYLNWLRTMQFYYIFRMLKDILKISDKAACFQGWFKRYIYEIIVCRKINILTFGICQSMVPIPKFKGHM